MVDPTGFAAQRFGNDSDTTRRAILTHTKYIDLANYYFRRAERAYNVWYDYDRSCRTAIELHQTRIEEYYTREAAIYKEKYEIYEAYARIYRDRADKTKNVEKIQEKTERQVRTVLDNNKEEVTIANLYGHVKTGGPWDYKLEDRRKQDIYLEGIADEKFVFINGYTMTWEEFGNYHYGYVVGACNLDLNIAKLGSYYADGFSGSYNEVRQDQWWVEKGLRDFYAGK